MSMELFFVAVIILLLLAGFDLTVGVSNDAANFLNSSIGSRVAPRWVILLVASLGIIMGVLFSSGMMEVARKGIFHPQFFTMPELMVLFLAVMMTDVLLLDMFNTFGLPTSTTVSIVFELLGAAVVVSFLKVIQTQDDLAALGHYINTAKAMTIIFGILLSVVVAFICGAIAQFITRLIFTFDYAKTLRRYGALWGGFALAAITLFILIKGASGASFITPERADWIKENSFAILGMMFVVSALVFQVLISVFQVNILRPIILVGTFALAMAFAANDLVNFIGVPLAGLHAYNTALLSDTPLTATMEALSGKLQQESFWLLAGGLIMVITLCLSRKARTVSQTEVNLARQDEGVELFESVVLSRVIVRMVSSFLDFVKMLIPPVIRKAVGRRFDPTVYHESADRDNVPSFDLIRASVNLMVASAVISWATSMKLPLSTTYVTFMVAMGTSFSDRAWDRESAVYRVTGVITVIGGWFMTAFLAFTVSGIFAFLIYFLEALGVVALIFLALLVLCRTHLTHKDREKESEEYKIFNLKKVTDAPKAIATTFEHTSFFLAEIRSGLDVTLEALFRQDLSELRKQKRITKKVQLWANIITANIFKAMRLLDTDEISSRGRYPQTIRGLQSIADAYRDIVIRSYTHINDHHKGLLDVQIEEIREIRTLLFEIIDSVETTLAQKHSPETTVVGEQNSRLWEITDQLAQKQVERIRDRSSKTRLSILFYAIMGDFRRISRQSARLVEVFHDSFPPIDEQNDSPVSA